MNLPAADLSKAIFRTGNGAGFSVALILSKYCLTLVSSKNTGCSRALTPLSRRYAKACIREGLPDGLVILTEQQRLNRVRDKNEELSVI
jgi:hypothetical protein